MWIMPVMGNTLDSKQKTKKKQTVKVTAASRHPMLVGRFWLSSMHLLGNTLCVFTAGATSALKLVGEAFPWSSKSEYLYMMENHNSKLGI
jgi:uncharacterized membrane protein